MWAVTVLCPPPPPSECAEAGIVLRRRDEGWGGRDLLVYLFWGASLALQHPRATPPGATQRGAMHDGCGRATGCREEGRRRQRGGGGTYRQPLCWGPPAGQCPRSRRSTGSRAGIVGQLNAIRPPLSAVCWAALSSQSPPPPPWPPQPSFPVCFLYGQGHASPPPHDKVTGPRVSLGAWGRGCTGVPSGGGGPAWDAPPPSAVRTPGSTPRHISAVMTPPPPGGGGEALPKC